MSTYSVWFLDFAMDNIQEVILKENLNAWIVKNNMRTMNVLNDLQNLCLSEFLAFSIDL